MAGEIVHFELMGPDGGALKTFYEDMFGWKTQAADGFDTYHMIDGDQTGSIGGAVGQGSDEMPSYSAIYIQVDSIDDQLERIEKAGGTTVMPKTTIPDMVTFAMFKDPAGNLVGLVEGGM